MPGSGAKVAVLGHAGERVATCGHRVRIANGIYRHIGKPITIVGRDGECPARFRCDWHVADRTEDATRAGGRDDGEEVS
jgi:hypothetical protein